MHNVVYHQKCWVIIMSLWWLLVLAYLFIAIISLLFRNEETRFWRGGGMREVSYFIEFPVSEMVWVNLSVKGRERQERVLYALQRTLWEVIKSLLSRSRHGAAVLLFYYLHKYRYDSWPPAPLIYRCFSELSTSFPWPDLRGDMESRFDRKCICRKNTQMSLFPRRVWEMPRFER